MKLSVIQYLRNRITLVRKISKLDISDAGIESDGEPYVRLKDGTIFYGLKSLAKDKKFYNLLPSKVKKILPFEAFQIANDIVIRFVEGGLMLGGPEKELFYKVKAGDKIAEMGAYMGYYTLYLSQKIGSNGKVIAIEPMPDNLKYLRKNIEANNIKNVVIVPKGVWKEKEKMTFERKKGDNQSGSVELSYDNNDSFSIPVDSLDSILAEQGVKHINMMLIQLNGVEPEALEGLNNYMPEHFAIAARYSKGEELATSIINRELSNRGYNCNIVNQDFLFAELKK